MGYLNTTGLKRMDYWITDALQNPPETQAYFSETLWFLPRCFVCYAAVPNAPEPAPPPLLQRGAPSFGCYNNMSKLSPRCVNLWAALLTAVPQARLVFKSVQSGDPAVQSRVGGWFQQRGIAPERLVYMPLTPHSQYLAAFAEIDVALDPFPYNGNTSTNDALWMGVPVVSFEGDNSISRSGVSLLTALGHPEWIARSEEEYVRIAAGLASDPARLAALRAGLREEMRRSPLMDGPGFARAMEDAFRGMWRAWCATQR
jgi:predicted O-linked N-acetylglucosamine transferase (SPINDLY family)